MKNFWVFSFFILFSIFSFAKDCREVFENQSLVLQRLFKNARRSVDPRIRAQLVRAGQSLGMGGGGGRISDAVSDATIARLVAQRTEDLANRSSLTAQKIIDILDPEPDSSKSSSSVRAPHRFELKHSANGQPLYIYRNAEGEIEIPKESFDFLAKTFEKLRKVPLPEGWIKLGTWTDQDVNTWFQMTVEYGQNKKLRTLMPSVFKETGHKIVNANLSIAHRNADGSLNDVDLSRAENDKRKNIEHIWNQIINSHFNTSIQLVQLHNLVEILIPKKVLNQMYFDTAEQVLIYLKDPKIKTYVSKKTKGADVGTVENSMEESRYLDTVIRLHDIYYSDSIGSPSSAVNHLPRMQAHLERYIEAELRGQPIEQDPFFLRGVLKQRLIKYIPDDVYSAIYMDFNVLRYDPETKFDNPRYAYILEHLRNKGYSDSSLSQLIYGVFFW